MARSRIGRTYISFGLSPWLGLRIRQQAAAEGVTISAMVRRVLAAYVDDVEDDDEAAA